MTPTPPVTTTAPDERAYYAALKLVDRLDPRPQLNTAWWVNGRLCVTLDEAVRALLEVQNAN